MNHTLDISRIVAGIKAVFPNARIELERNDDFSYRYGHPGNMCVRVCSGNACVREPIAHDYRNTEGIVQHAVRELSAMIAHEAMRRCV